jgi:hypothetical protein
MNEIIQLKFKCLELFKQIPRICLSEKYVEACNMIDFNYEH